MTEKRASFPDLLELARGPVRTGAYARRVWRDFYDAVRAFPLAAGQEDPRAGGVVEWANLADALVMHTSIETDAGAGLYNFNFGYMVGQGDAGSFSATDRDADFNVHSAQFRAYSSRTRGVLAYVTAIHERFPTAWRVARDAPDRYLVELKRTGYLAGVCGGDSPRPCTDDELAGSGAARLSAVRAATEGMRPTALRGSIGVGASASIFLTALFAGVWGAR